jgi:hypothetical protein
VDAEEAESGGGGGIIRGSRVRRVDEEGATAPPTPLSIGRIYRQIVSRYFGVTRDKPIQVTCALHVMSPSLAVSNF